MKEWQENQDRSWAEEHGGTIFGVSVFVLLGLFVAVMRLYG
jgi:hypothetical protein